MKRLNASTKIDKNGFIYKLDKIRNGFVYTRYLYEWNFLEREVEFVEAILDYLNDEFYY